jgi:hypothetical protein
MFPNSLQLDLMLKDTCDQICSDLKHVTSESHVRDCLPDEYKMHKRKRVTEESTDELRQSGVNDDKNILEQTAMTVDTEGYERPFDAKRKDVESASEIVKTLQKKVVDITHERDDLSKTVEVLKEKSLPEMFHEIMALSLMFALSTNDLICS